MKTKSCLLAFVLIMTAAHAWADGPQATYADGGVAESLDDDESLVNVDGAQEDPNHRMSPVARAYRNGLISGRQSQKEADARQVATVAPVPHPQVQSVQPQPYQPQYPQYQPAQVAQYRPPPEYVQEPLEDDLAAPAPQVIVQNFVQPPPQPQVIVQYVQPPVAPQPYGYGYAQPVPVQQPVIVAVPPAYRGGYGRPYAYARPYAYVARPSGYAMGGYRWR